MPATTGICGTADDREIEEYLALCGQRIQDLKGDVRFKYVSVFKNFGTHSGQEFDHPTSEVVATTFVPRRVLYELRAARQHYQVKERCVFCDIFEQEQEAEDARHRSPRRLHGLVPLRSARAL